MRGLSQLVTLVAILLACFPVLAGAQATEIKQQWLVGKRYEFSEQIAQDIDVVVGSEKKVGEKSGKATEFSLTVRPHEDGLRKRLTLKYERVAVELNRNGKQLGFDSAKPGEGDDPLTVNKRLGALAGKEVQMVVSEKDEIGEIENYDDFLKSFPPAVTEDAPKFYSQQFLKLQAKELGMLQSLPGRPVSLGDRWPYSLEIEAPLIGKVALKGFYTFEGVEEHDGHTCARIALDLALTMAVGGEASQAPKLKALDMKLGDSSAKGTVWFDLALGATRGVESDQVFKVTMKSAADPTQTVEMTMTQKLLTVLTKVEDLK